MTCIGDILVIGQHNLNATHQLNDYGVVINFDSDYDKWFDKLPSWVRINFRYHSFRKCLIIQLYLLSGYQAFVIIVKTNIILMTFIDSEMHKRHDLQQVRCIEKL